MNETITYGFDVINPRSEDHLDVSKAQEHIKALKDGTTESILYFATDIGYLYYVFAFPVTYRPEDKL